MKINWNYIKSFFLIGLVTFIFGFSNQRNTNQKVNSIEVLFEEGDNLFMNYEMVNKLLIQNTVSVKNKAKSLIDLNDLEKQVLEHPMVENASTFITIDGLLKAKIKQRTPIGRVKTELESYYIDRLGTKMPLSKNYSARVPIITGKVDQKNKDDLYKLLMYIRKDTFLNKQIVGINIADNNEFSLTTRIGNQEILIGGIEDISTKFKNLKVFYNYTSENDTIDNYSVLSLKYKNQVVCTKKLKNGA